MLNTNNNLQTQTSNALHNAIMEVGGKDNPLMLEPSSLEITTEGYMENYKNVSQDIRNQLDVEAEAVQIILTKIDNDIYSTVDACPNACEMWKLLKVLTSITTKMEKKIYKPTNNNLGTSSNTSRANQDNTPRINRGTGYDNQRVVNVVGARENVGTQVVQQFGIQCYNCKEYGHVVSECQKPKWANDATYHKEKILLCKQEEAGFQLNAKQADWRDDTDDEPEDHELEAHYLYMAQIQEVTPDAADNSGPIFDVEPLQKDDDDLARERDLFASLIEKLKCEIDERNYHNTLLESLNKTSNIELAKNNQLMFKDLKKFQAELNRYHDVNYASKMEINSAKAKGELVSQKCQFCDANLEVAFWKSACYIRNLKRNDLLTGSCGTNIYSITLQDTSTPNLILLMAKASSSQAWLWYRHLSHLNFNTINLLSKYDIVTGLPKLKFVKDNICYSCELGKAKCKSLKTKTTPSSKRRLQILHMDLCGPMRVESFNVKKYMLAIVDDYSRYLGLTS
ncbi:retrovirus-related pol polyprotein from transposon TNT 1-94 [Tanacetum coccineum]